MFNETFLPSFNALVQLNTQIMYITEPNTQHHFATRKQKGCLNVLYFACEHIFIDQTILPVI